MRYLFPIVIACVPTLPALAQDAMQQAQHELHATHGERLNYLLLGERFEYARDAGRDSYQWEAQAWLGYDRDKLWLKTEGHYDADANSTERMEWQALYSRAIAPFWDVQLGLRHDSGAYATRNYAVVGLQGLAPYWFELDMAVFLSERGDFSARAEAEYELRFSQRLLLQPRVEVNLQGSDDPEAGVGQGLSEASIGLRLRYEWRREFAPYLGLEWVRAFGDTADLLQRDGLAREESRVVAGLRFWY